MEKITRTEASRAGLTRYFSGNYCRHGHRAERMVSNGVCVECLLARYLKWRKTGTTQGALSCKN